MGYQLPKCTNTLSLLKKLYVQDRSVPAESVFDQNSPAIFCSICLDDIRGGDTHRKLPQCMHSFHSGCIDAWFESRSTCPLCRIEVPRFISSSENGNDLLGDFVSSFVSLAQKFFEKILDPDTNEAISSLMYGDIRSGL